MVMKKIYAFLIALFALTAVSAQGVLPEFSTTDAPKWYIVQFAKGGHTLLDNGVNNDLITANRAVADAQQWQFIGTKEGFYMRSKLGNWLGFKNNFYYSVAEAAKVRMTVQETSAEGGNWEIKRVGQSSCLNQYQGTGVGVRLSEWTAGDGNNALAFHPTSVDLPVFSGQGSETWYFVKMNNGGRYMADTAVAGCIVLSSPDPVDGQLWKLEGTQDNFQLVNKLGRYAVVSNVAQSGSLGGNNPTPVRSSETPYAAGFSLQASGASTGPGWEIHPNDRAGKNFNLWGGASGTIIGLWNANDNNTPITFIEPDKMVYPDFKSVGINGYAPDNKLTLWYDQPATTAPLYSGGNGYSNWMEYSLPIGDGQFGASLFGGIEKDEIQFNEKTLWSGRSTDSSSDYGYYENFGSVYAEELSDVFSYVSTSAAKDYYRQLDLSTATGKVSYKSPDGAVTYTREYISSNPARVVAARYSASVGGKINLRFTLASSKALKAATAYADGSATFSGKLPVVSYNARMKVIPTGGEMTTGEDGITVRGADEVLVILAGGTDYDPQNATYVSNTAALAGKVEAWVNDAAAKTWAEIYSEQQADYKSFFDRVHLDLEGTVNDVPTDRLVDTYAQGAGPNARMLEQLYFAYGRYLSIGSSRGVDLPSNLQGIWNNIEKASWHCDIHSNINVQMNYWPSETTNLSELHLPFLNYIINMADSKEWKAYARESGQTRGWTCYTENNIFGGTGGFMKNYVIANAWYCSHLWQHYRYTLDKDFLKRAFPAMLTASQYWMDRLVKAADGTYEAPREYSPEHGPGSENATAHAQQLIYDLFESTLKAIDILGNEVEVSAADLEKLQDRFAHLDKGLAIERYTGQWGANKNGVKTGEKILREWKYSQYTAGADGHRHMSHLMCLYPFSQVKDGTDLYKAAVNSLKLRGDGATGWSMGWKINLWARAKDGNHTHTILKNALRHANGGAGVFYNLYDSHAPFQIDGNFGACAGMAEMLMQSHTDSIEILPALPAAWSAGEVSGLKAVGDFTVSIVWKGGKPLRVTVVNNQGQPGYVKYPGINTAMCIVNGEEVLGSCRGTDLAVLKAEKGAVTVFDFTQVPTGIGKVGAAGTLSLAVKGRTITLDGADLKSVKVFDLGGRMIHHTRMKTFAVDAAAGNVAVVEALAKDGQKSVFKVTLQ